MKQDTKKYPLTINLDENCSLVPLITIYVSNGRLAILIYDEDGEFFCDMTVNLPRCQLSKKANNLAFIDTNNCPWLPDFIDKHQLGAPTGHIGFSGFCEYPEYEFDLSKLNTDI